MSQKNWKLWVAALTAGLSLLLLLCAAPAADRTVTSLADSGAGSLREAINLVGIGDTINVAVFGTITLTSGELLIGDSVTISGPGAAFVTVARSSAAGTPDFRVFHLKRRTYASPFQVTISGLTISHGRTSIESGGGLRYNGEGSFSEATLTLDSCAFTENYTDGNGGGLFVLYGKLVMRNCALIGNGAAGFGGGIGIQAAETLGYADPRWDVFLGSTIQTCTIYGNTAESGAGIDLYGSDLQVISCTIADNPTGTATIGPKTASCIRCKGNLRVVVKVENSILQHDTATSRAISYVPTLALPDPGPHGESMGFNIVSDFDAGLTYHSSDPFAVYDARLRPGGPRYNGGPTPTIALLGNSPALDKGHSFGLTTDQRGQARPRDFASISNGIDNQYVIVGDGGDIGAFEAADLVQPGTVLMVNTADDHDDGLAGMGDCTLREAIAWTNSSRGPRTGGEDLLLNADMILFAPNVIGAITLDLELGPLSVTGPLTLAGPGARKLTLSGNDTTKVLSFTAGSAGSVVSGLTLRDGLARGASPDGGGIFNAGMLTVADCTFFSHTASSLPGTQPGQAGGTSRGGAIYNGGTLQLHRCGFRDNVARGGSSLGSSVQFAFGPGGGEGLGGAVFNNTGATLTADNCTFFNNTGTGGTGANNTGAGAIDGNGGRGFGTICNQGTMTLTSCTLMFNLGTGGAGGGTGGRLGAAGGGLATSGGTSTVRNTISADNTGLSGPDAFGAFISEGYNLIENNNGSTGFTATGDQTGTSAQLGLIQNNGGPTDTMLLMAGSPAYDKGKRFGLTTDQRNLPRPYDVPSNPNASGGDSTDIGAVEMQPAYTGPVKLLSCTRIGPTARVLLQGTAFVTYQLQQSENLVTPFANLGAPQPTDSIGQTEFTDYGPLPARRFYRAIQSP